MEISFMKKGRSLKEKGNGSWWIYLGGKTLFKIFTDFVHTLIGSTLTWNTVNKYWNVTIIHINYVLI